MPRVCDRQVCQNHPQYEPEMQVSRSTKNMTSTITCYNMYVYIYIYNIYIYIERERERYRFRSMVGVGLGRARAHEGARASRKTQRRAGSRVGDRYFSQWGFYFVCGRHLYMVSRCLLNGTIVGVTSVTRKGFTVWRFCACRGHKQSRNS